MALTAALVSLGGVNVSQAVETSPAATFAPAPVAQNRASRHSKGALRVTLNGMPTGATAKVIVHGPGPYRSTLATSRRLARLVPGKYGVKFGAFLTQQAGSFTVQTSARHVRVRAHRTAHVTIRVRWVPADASPADPQPGSTTTPTPSPSTPAPRTGQHTAPRATEAEVVTLTNQARAHSQDCGKYGVFPPAPALSVDAKLTTAARGHAVDMATDNFFDHVNQQGQDPGDRITAAGYDWREYGENIAAGQTSPAEVVADWIDSDGHCENLMNPDVTEIGVGYASDAGSDYGEYWVQDFARPMH